ncbi:hypothetical protein [Sphingobium sp. HWE2-09]|uniref:hypothetical protein n=1 Tax=Sphingobium sp. HWE2-09 TaxID=3108390 RepID=UPI002DC10A1C|nr:hypothetical protein [Sphingobium sp. HWE2-09]
MIARSMPDLPILLFGDVDCPPCAVYYACPQRFSPLNRGLIKDGIIINGNLLRTGDACASRMAKVSFPMRYGLQPIRSPDAMHDLAVPANAGIADFGLLHRFQ